MSGLKEDYATLYTEFIIRFPEDSLIRDFNGEQVIVRHNSFVCKTNKKDEVLCFLVAPDYFTTKYLRHCIYKDGIWANPGPSMRVDGDYDFKHSKIDTADPVLVYIPDNWVARTDNNFMDDFMKSSIDGVMRDIRRKPEQKCEPGLIIKEQNDLILEIFYNLCNSRKDFVVEDCMTDAINAYDLLIKRPKK